MIELEVDQMLPLESVKSHLLALDVLSQTFLWSYFCAVAAAAGPASRCWPPQRSARMLEAQMCLPRRGHGHRHVSRHGPAMVCRRRRWSRRARCCARRCACWPSSRPRRSDVRWTGGTGGAQRVIRDPRRLDLGVSHVTVHNEPHAPTQPAAARTASATSGRRNTRRSWFAMHQECPSATVALQVIRVGAIAQMLERVVAWRGAKQQRPRNSGDGGRRGVAVGHIDAQEPRERRAHTLSCCASGAHTLT